MKILFITLLAFIISFSLISCGDDNPQNNNGGETETLIYSRDTFNIETNEQGNFYTFNQLNASFDTCKSVRLSFTIAHNLDSTDSRGVFTWGANFEGDSVNTASLRGSHSIVFTHSLKFNEIGFYNVIYFSNSTMQKYIHLTNLKVYKIN